MKVVKDGEETFVIYLLTGDKKYKLEEKQEIIKLVKNTVLRANRIYRLNLKGFYKVRVYLNQKVGLVIEIINVDDISLNDAIDLRVLVYFDQDFYIEVDNFDFLPLHKKVLYVDDQYYINVDTLSEQEIFSLLEFGEIIYKTDVIDNFRFAKLIEN